MWPVRRKVDGLNTVKGGTSFPLGWRSSRGIYSGRMWNSKKRPKARCGYGSIGGFMWSTWVTRMECLYMTQASTKRVSPVYISVVIYTLGYKDIPCLKFSLNNENTLICIQPGFGRHSADIRLVFRPTFGLYSPVGYIRYMQCHNEFLFLCFRENNVW